MPLTHKIVLAEGNGLLATVWSACAQLHRGPGSAWVLGGSRDVPLRSR